MTMTQVPPVSEGLSRESEALRALQAFLTLTTSGSEQDRALRALTLHMLEGFAPRAFERWKLGSVLEEAVRALESFPLEFPLDLTADDGLARLDAVYVRHMRGLSPALPEREAFERYVLHLDETGDSLYAWLLFELMKGCGLLLPLFFPERPFKPHSRLVDLYQVTHFYLLDTHYLRAPLGSPEAPSWTEELLAAGPWLLEEHHLDLAAEVAFCLQTAGEAGSDTCQRILDALVRAQQPDGSVADTTLGEEEEDSPVAHTTAAALLAFAGAQEHSGSTPG
jgi:D-amino peptidase